jgi:hypothetical protein
LPLELLIAKLALADITEDAFFGPPVAAVELPLTTLAREWNDDSMVTWRSNAA